MNNRYGVLGYMRKGEQKGYIYWCLCLCLCCCGKVLHLLLLVVLHDAEGQVELRTLNFSAWRNLA